MLIPKQTVLSRSVESTYGMSSKFRAHTPKFIADLQISLG